MKPFVITVDFRIHPGRMSAFLPLMIENAKQSAALEPGCRQFDVLVPDKGDDWVRLYEVYDDEAAFDAHRTFAHYLAFKQATQDMIAQTTVTRFSRVAGGLATG